MKFNFLTYGCKVNRYETELIRQELLKRGVTEGGDADCYLINTCTVTGKIDNEILRKVKQLKAAGKTVIVTGCLASAAGIEKLKKYADFIIPNADKFKPSAYPVLVDRLTGEADSVLTGFSGRSRAFAKLESGCNRFCAYCEVPYVRGSAIASRDALQVVEEVKALTDNGFSEIVLTGVNLGLYGAEKNDKNALARLVEKLITIEGLGRLRLSSIGPNETTGELIDAVAGSGGKVCPHFHMSLQSGDEAVLRRMNRNYTAKEFEEKTGVILSKLPLCALTTDIIAGFPGETAKEHKNTLAFVSRVAFTRLHVFPYSDRPDTKASKMQGKLDEAVKKERVKELIALGKEKEKEFISKNLGLSRGVLVEEEGDGEYMTGYTDNYIKVLFEGKKEMAGKLQEVKLVSMKQGKVYGEI